MKVELGETVTGCPGASEVALGAALECDIEIELDDM